MSEEEKTVRASEICTLATDLIEPLVQLCAQRHDSMQVGYVALCLAARAVRQMGIDSFGPEFAEELEKLDHLVESGSSFADEIATRKLMSCAKWRRLAREAHIGNAGAIAALGMWFDRETSGAGIFRAVDVERRSFVPR